MIAATIPTYESCEPTIRTAVRIHRRRWGGDMEELMCEAGLIYVEAVRDYDPDRGAKFVTWLCNRIRNKLRDQARSRMRRKLPVKALYEEPAAPSLTDTLSEDADLLIRLALTAPRELLTAGAARKRKGGNKIVTAGCVKDYLKLALNWPKRRIKETFEEIREALA